MATLDIDGVQRVAGGARPMIVITLAGLTTTDDKHAIEAVYERILSAIDVALDESGDGRYDLLVFCGLPSPQVPWSWAVRAFKRMPRRYRKQIAALYLVHERTWVRVLLQLTERLVSRKFQRKVHHLGTLEELAHDHPDIYARVVDRIDLRVWTHDSQLMNEFYDDGRTTAAAQTATAKHRPPTPPPRRRQIIIYEDEPDEPDATIDIPAETITLPVLPKRPAAALSSRTPSPPQREARPCIVATAPESPRRVQRASSAPSTATDRDTLAPLPARSSSPSKPASCAAAAATTGRPKGATNLRRAISGPLTPAHNKLNAHSFVPRPSSSKGARETNNDKAAGRPRKVPAGDSRVNNLRRLFEERLELQQALCQ